MKNRITICAVLGLIFQSNNIAKAGEQIELQKIGTWQNVVSFHINRDEDHIVLTMLDAQGQELAYEAFKHSGEWGNAQPIDEINSHIEDGIQIGGICMTDNEERIYFHANFPNGVGGTDIYYCERTKDGWSDPQLELELSTPDNETYPTITNGGNTIYLLRHRVVANQKQEKKESDKQSIYYADKNAQNKWTKLQPVNNALNYGWVQDAQILSDGKTMFYSIREERKAPAVAIYTRTSIAGEWYLPEPLFVDESGYDYYSPQYGDKKIYAIRSNNKKRIRSGSIVSTPCPEKFIPQEVMNESGAVLTQNSHKPIEAIVNVYNPTTNAVLGRYKSTSFDGVYDITNLASNNYIVDVRSSGYSYASYQLNYKEQKKRYLPQTIELFDTIQLDINIYDAEIFRPLVGKVIAVRQTDKNIFRSQALADGRYSLKLPLGSDYNIIATGNGFEENKFLFKLAGDIVYSRFERNLPLEPKKKTIKVSVYDAETKAPLNANINFVNLKREENIDIKAKSIVNGQVDVSLRYFDRYELTVSGVQNYAFHNRQIDVEHEADEIAVFLIPLRANTSVMLNNINFATASADIMPDSYSELDRVVKLLNENKGLRLEIAAHTDNVGVAAYNMLLSERRAQSVLSYLVENGVDASSVVAKGYGLTKPLVPNTTEENRAKNRRVEFKILEAE
mgnify:CR=1 FL=1